MATINQPPRLQLGDAPLAPFSNSSTDQVAIVWQTIGSLASDTFIVEYRTPGGAWQPVTNREVEGTGVGSRTMHVSTIDGLAYDSSYEYQVRHLIGGTEVASFSNTFETRLAPGDTQSFSFAAYGDSADPGQNTGFLSIQQQINVLDPDFALLLGDNAYNSGTHSEYDARFDPDETSAGTLDWIGSHIDYATIGNHELFSGGSDYLESYANPTPVAGVTSPVGAPAGGDELYYSFDYGDAHFVTFDSNVLNNQSALNAARDYVVADLNASDARWKIVFAHHPVGGAPDKPEGPEDAYWQTIVEDFSDAGADLFLVGHSHTYSWSYPLTGNNGNSAAFVLDTDKVYDQGDGMVQVISGVGGGGSGLRNGSFNYDFIAEGYSTSTNPSSEFGFAHVTVTPDELEVDYVGATSGNVLGSFRILSEQTPPQETGDLTITSVGGINLSSAEIVDYDPIEELAYVTAGSSVQLIDLTGNAANPTAISPVNLGPLASNVVGITSNAFAETNDASGTLPERLIALAVSGTDQVRVYDAATLGNIANYNVGNGPDSLAFNGDGTHLVVANEGEGNFVAGGISIIDLVAGTSVELPFAANVTNANLQNAGVRLSSTSISPANDLEPEYVTVIGNTAFITLQENNAVLRIDDVTTATSIGLGDFIALGSKDHSMPGAGLDPSDIDDVPNIGNFPVRGLYQPDGIAAFETGGQTYFVTANEGDTRGDAARVNSLNLDPTAFPDAATLKQNDQLGRLQVSLIDGDTDGDGDFDELYAFGGRSFSIFDETGNRVFDSGDDFERILADNNQFFDDRSDNRGPEPEAVVVGQVGARSYAFIALERTSDVFAYDVTDPANAFYVARFPNANLNLPEGLRFVAAEDSPTGEALLLVASEGGSPNRLQVFEIESNVTEDNLAPIAVADSVTLTEDSTVNVAVLGNDSDPDLDPITLEGFGSAANGNVIQIGQTLQYTPGDNFNGTDSFSYTISDGSLSSSAVVNVTVLPQPDDPTAVNDFFTVDEGTVLTGSLLSNDFDVDGEVVALVSVNGQTSQTITFANGGVLTWTPSGSFVYNQNGAYDGLNAGDEEGFLINYTIMDPTGRDDFGAAQITVAGIGGVEDLTLTFENGQNGYNGVRDTYLLESNPNTILGNGSSLNVDGLVNGVGEGQGLIRFEDIFGSDIGQIQSNDTIVSATLDLNVFNAGDAMSVHDMLISWSESSTWNSLGNGVQVNGIDASIDTVINTGSVPVGLLSLDVTSSLQAWQDDPTTNLGWLFAPTDDNGVDFSSSETANGPVLTVEIERGEAQNSAPTAEDDTETVDEDGVVLINVLANDSDPDLDEISIASVSTPSFGTAAIVNGQIEYTPDANFNGEDTFTYTISDGELVSDPASVTVTVNPVNDVPVGFSDVVSAVEDFPITINVLDNDTDIDGDTLSIASFNQPNNGTVTQVGQSLVYTPDANESGLDTFTYTPNDGTADGQEVSVVVFVEAVNDPVVTEPDIYTATEGESLVGNLLDNDFDIEGQAISVLSVGGQTTSPYALGIGDAEIVWAPDGSFELIQNGAFDYLTAGETLELDIGYIAIDDGQDAEPSPGTFKITVEGTSAGGEIVDLVFEDGLNGYDGTLDTFIVEGLQNSAFFTSQYMLFSANYSSFGEIQSLLQFEDIFGSTVSQIQPGDVILSAQLELTQFGGPTTDLSLNQMLVDWDNSATWNSLGDGVQTDGVDAAATPIFDGTLSGTTTIDVTSSVSSWLADPSSNNGWALLTDLAPIGIVASTDFSASPPKLTVTVSRGDNLPPEAVDDEETASTLGGTFIDVLANDSDPDGGTLEIVGLTQPQNGTVALGPENDVVYFPNPGFSGIDTFEYTVSDGQGGESSATVSVEVTALPDGDYIIPAYSQSQLEAAGLLGGVVTNGTAFVLPTDADTLIYINDDDATLSGAIDGTTTPVDGIEQTATFVVDGLVTATEVGIYADQYFWIPDSDAPQNWRMLFEIVEAGGDGESYYTFYDPLGDPAPGSSLTPIFVADVGGFTVSYSDLDA